MHKVFGEKAPVPYYDRKGAYLIPVKDNKIAVIKTPKGKTVLDFGQNIAGYVSFTVKAKAGQKAKLRFGEMLDNDGELTLKNIQ